MNPNVIFAVFRRNFAGYFSSPLGYLFICAFVLMSGFAAFWPNDFFNSNLATLDQLNQYLPWIMLVFIPAITMSIWADERRQGTDELLLTLPGSDFDVVIGKYLAALAIFTVALLFSLSNILVLRMLGHPDVGLLIANYIGYWFVGAAMLSVGMVASFLTNSLTVGFVLGLAFNAPLVFAAWGDALVPSDGVARFIKAASLAEQFNDFGRGSLTLSGIVFFGSILIVSLYLSMVLIGKRHWIGSARGPVLVLHYTIRAASLAVLAVGLNLLADRFNVHVDATNARVNSLSPQTSQILKNLDIPRPVFIEAYISPRVPEEYVQTRINLLSMLREVDVKGGGKVVVHVHNTDRFSPEETQAEEQFGIRRQPVSSTAGGKFAIDEIVMGAAFTCGLDKVVVPFFDKGIPAEYEVIRSIATVGQQNRKKIGVVQTDAKLFGGFDFERMSSQQSQQIIEELQKQYEVVAVNAEQPITERYDALLAIQPSSLSPMGMTHLIAAVRSGQPTAIFEDPFPYLDQNVPATSQPRQTPRQNPFQQAPPPPPKADVGQLWHALGIRSNPMEVVWQQYNPYPKLQDLPEEFVFVAPGSGADNALDRDDEITGGLQQLLAVFPGSLSPEPGSSTRFQPLLRTGVQTGSVAYNDLVQRNFLGQASLVREPRRRPTGVPYVLAARVTGPSESVTPEGTAAQLNTVVVADNDLLYSVFFSMRARGNNKNDPVDIRLDNVTFVLNTLDALAGDDRFIALRKRHPAYRTLTTVEKKTERAKKEASDARDKFNAEFEAKRTEEQASFDKKLQELQARQGIDKLQMMNEVEMARKDGERRLQAATDRMEKDRDKELDRVERDLALQVRGVQDRYKLAAVVFPPIPPLLVGAFIFFRRRSMERIGVPKSRLR